ncbi:DUF371 domain-containing protein [Candidatus Woesearchaeota archaeon]|nr:DUF371 domain-containing protein [Candidatus Woesearchaeota archaeon]
MGYSFNCYGHENITARHKTTIEFTKEKYLSLKGDCIIGVRADFSLAELRRFIESIGGKKEVTITIETVKESCNKENNNRIKNNKIVEKINAEINPKFNSGKEIVIRKTDFVSERTFAVKSDKAAFELDMDLIDFLRKKGEIRVVVERRR